MNYSIKEGPSKGCINRTSPTKDMPVSPKSQTKKFEDLSDSQEKTNNNSLKEILQELKEIRQMLEYFIYVTDRKN